MNFLLSIDKMSQRLFFLCAIARGRFDLCKFISCAFLIVIDFVFSALLNNKATCLLR